jgi:predicted permease
LPIADLQLGRKSVFGRDLKIGNWKLELMMDSLLKDIRYGVRSLLKRPGFTAIAAITLALGIGANTTIFSVVNGILLRPLPGISRPDRLIDVHATEPNGSSFHSFSYPDYEYYREHNQVFDGLMAYTGIPLSMNAGSQPERIFGMIVTGNYFNVLGTRPAQGRFFAPEEDQTPNTHPVAVLSYGLWQQRFGADQAVIGKTITLNGHAFTVIGIAPQGFRGTWAGLVTDAWVPMMMQAQVRPGGQLLTARGARWLEVDGRLKDSVTLGQAQTAMNALAAQVAQGFPETNRGLGVDLKLASTIPGQMRGAVIGFMAILMAIVGLVLLIACTNVGAMTLARASARRRELAIRLAVGAGRWRIVRQLLIESVLLFLIGGGTGILIAVWAIRFLLAYKLPADVPVSLDLGVDIRVLLFTLLVSLGTGLLFGLAPAFQASKTDVLSALKNDSPGGTQRSRMRSAFVVAQISISLVLLITASLFLRSLRNASTIDLGFHPEGVETVTFDLRTQGYKEDQGRQFYRELQQRVAALPGVQSVSLARMVPLNGSNMRVSVNVAGAGSPEEQRTNVGFNVVDTRYFETMELPILRGRSFNDSDKQGAPAVAIINETMARRFYPGDDVSTAVGKSFSGLESKDGGRVEIVGVAKDAKYETLGEDPQPFVYQPYQQSYSGEMTMHIRATDGASVLAAVRREVTAIDKDLPLLNVMPLTEQIGVSLLPLKVAATVGGTLGTVGVVLAAIGIFGIVNYSVSQRTREIGIRMALGARTWDVLRLILRQGLWLALLGVGIGLGIAFALTRALGSLLYGVGATDPLIFIGTSLALIAIAFFASYQPARRATRVDPLEALRYE